MHWITSEALAIQLYGKNWAKLVIDVPDAFFVDYKRAADISSPMYPDGTAVRSANSTYFVEGGKWRKFTSEDAIKENNIPAQFVIETTVQVPASGQAITAFEELVGYPTNHSAPVL